eukprot:3274484-Pyramimonas_sp.AAC.1
MARVRSDRFYAWVFINLSSSSFRVYVLDAGVARDILSWIETTPARTARSSWGARKLSALPPSN